MHQHHFFIFPSSIHMMRRKKWTAHLREGREPSKIETNYDSSTMQHIFYPTWKKKLVEKKKRSRFFPPIFSPINHHIILNATLFWQQLKDRINPKTVCINTLILWDIKLIYYLGLSYKMQLLKKITYHTRAIISRGFYIFQA